MEQNEELTVKVLLTCSHWSPLCTQITRRRRRRSVAVKRFMSDCDGEINHRGTALRILHLTVNCFINKCKFQIYHTVAEWMVFLPYIEPRSAVRASSTLNSKPGMFLNSYMFKTCRYMYVCTCTYICKYIFIYVNIYLIYTVCVNIYFIYV